MLSSLVSAQMKNFIKVNWIITFNQVKTLSKKETNKNKLIKMIFICNKEKINIYKIRIYEMDTFHIEFLIIKNHQTQ